jgi:hypothetical protein
MMIRSGRHLTYCSNIHAGESWTDIKTALARTLPRVREQLEHKGPLAVGLRLSAAAAHTLDDRAELAAFAEFLAAGDYYVPTINGFPYGAFHGTRVKQRVYDPDWRSAERVKYSNRLARVLAALNPDALDIPLSISTVPGAFRAAARDAAAAREVAAGMLRHASYLKRVREDTGCVITLAIEPEPACLIETVDEAVRFFCDHLTTPTAVAAATAPDGSALTIEDVRTHIGVCLDACHMAVEFEDPATVLRTVSGADIRIAKVQLSSALRVVARPGSPPAQQLLSPFSEDTYLHQVVVSTDAGLERFTDLPDALAAPQLRREDAEWRVHFHVPIFLETMSGFDTTQRYLASFIDELEQRNVATCLEVETYTWDVLPPEYRTTDVATAIARELQWVRDKLKH